MRDFKEHTELTDLLSEISIEGDIGNLFLGKAKNNNLTELDIKIKRMTVFIKSLESIKDEYKESDEEKIEKIYSSIEKKYDSKLKSLYIKFEKDLNTVLFDMGNDINKTFQV